MNSEPPPGAGRDLALANANAAIWAVGNGLVSSMLAVYFALELGAPGSAVGLILAAPRFAGLLRPLAPLLLQRVRRRKPLCLAFFFASTATLVAMPVLSAPGFATQLMPSLATDFVALGAAGVVGVWCLYHLLEYCGVVLLWAWLGDLMPADVRGRLVGQRESWLLLGRVAGIAASFFLVGYLRKAMPDAPGWMPLAWSALLGAQVMQLSILPLALMRSAERRSSGPTPGVWSRLWRALSHKPYRRLMAYSAGSGVANGVSHAAHLLLPQRVLGVTYETMVCLRGGMFAGQAAVAPAAGRLIDRYGARRVLIVAQLIVATGPLLFLLAMQDQWWWIAAAYAVWVGYAAINTGMDELKISLAPPGERSASLAAYYAVSDLAAGVMAVVGGVPYDILSAGGEDAAWVYAGLLVGGWAARSSVAFLAARLPSRTASPSQEEA